MHISTTIKNLAKTIIIITAATHSISSFANTNCATFSLSTNNYGKSVKVILNPLVKKIHNKAYLEKILAQIKEDFSSANNSQHMGYKTMADDPIHLKEFIEGTEENIWWHDPANLVASRLPIGYPTHPNDEKTSPLNAKILTISRERVQAYECHQRAGWPSATDYDPSSNSSQANKKSTPPGSPIAQAPPPSPRTSKTPGSNQSISSENREQHERQQSVAENLREQHNSYLHTEGKGFTKLYISDYANPCIFMRNIEEDGMVKNLYWHELINICSIDLIVHWCDKPDCKQVTSAATIRSGGREKSWMSSGGKRPSFYGHACELSYMGNQVLFDHKNESCVAWIRQ